MLLSRLAGAVGKRARGRPWALPLRTRVLIALVSLRTNLTTRALAALYGTSQSQVQRIIAQLTPLLGTVLARSARPRRGPWILDGTLVPAQDHSRAAISKNYRYSVNVQLIAHARTGRLLSPGPAWPGNRNDITIAKHTLVDLVAQLPGTVLADGGYRSLPGVRLPPREDPEKLHAHRSQRARIEHIIARLKDWQILRNCRRKRQAIDDAITAIVALYNHIHAA